MHSRDIVRKAWQITQVHLKKLIWYGSIPAFFTVIVSSIYSLYQYNAFRHSELFAPGEKSDLKPMLQMIWTWISSHPWGTVLFVIVALLFLLGYVILPPIFNGTLIAAVMRIHDFKPIDGSLETGLRKFFPLFEFGLLTGSFGVLTLFTEGSFILRWWGVNVFLVALPMLIFISIIGLIITFLFTYAQYYIVLQDSSLIGSIKESVILVLSNFRKTILIFLLMLLIGVRVVLNVVLVLLIPMGMVALGSFFSHIFSSIIILSLLGAVALALLLVSSYLFGLFHIFSTAVWVLTFAVLARKAQPKDSASEHEAAHGAAHEAHGPAVSYSH